MYVHLCLDDMHGATLRIIVRKKTNKMQQLDVYYQHFLNMIRVSLCPSSGDQIVCYCTWCAALFPLDVVGSDCGALLFRVRVLWTLLSDSNSNIHSRN